MQTLSISEIQAVSGGGYDMAALGALADAKGFCYASLNMMAAGFACYTFGVGLYSAVAVTSVMGMTNYSLGYLTVILENKNLVDQVFVIDSKM